MARDNPGSKRSRRIEASQADAPAEKARSLAPLRLIFSEALRYPDKVAYALLALMVTAAATLAIPAALQLVIDRGFADGGRATLWDKAARIGQGALWRTESARCASL